MLHTAAFQRCLKSHSKRSPVLRPLLQDTRVLAELAAVSREFCRRETNQSSFVLCGKLHVRSKHLLRAVRGAIQQFVDDEAACSIYEVRRLAANIILVKCASRDQRMRITNCRRAFSSAFRSSWGSADVQRVFQARLFVDDYCTQEQLDIRHSMRQVFQELKTARMKPHFRGETLFYNPAGAKCAIAHTGEQSSSEQQLEQPQQPRAHHQAVVLEEQQQQPGQQQLQQLQLQPCAEQAVVQPQHVARQPALHTPIPAATTSARAPSPTPQERATPQVAAAAAPSATAPQHQPLAPKEAGHQQIQQTHPAVNAAGKQRTTRPPLRTTTNTAPRPPNRATESTKQQQKPVWGGHGGVRKAPAGRTPHMLPNGQVVFY